MAANIKFDQSGLPAGAVNRSREDIVPGTAVTITNVNPGTTNTLELLWKPPEDDTAVITGSSPSWSIVPKAGTDGTYRFRLTVDGVVRRMTCSTLEPLFDLPIPASNEIADPTASLVKNTSTEIDASERNLAFAPFTSGSAFGHWKLWERWLRKIVSLFNPSGGHNHDGTGTNGPLISSGGDLEWTTEKTGNYTAIAREFVLCDPSGGAFQVDAPASPANNDKFGVKNHTGSTNIITIDGNGKNFDGGVSTRVINLANQWRVFQFSTVADEWLEVGG